ncbi:monosaccharide ABC transporter ATP-binding protein (CUT2 family) [Hoeflea marina]|uniref:Monosaccharide ABC transporter ATP-binding protein (CUT2 family) n=1 Tax=Hoeflea marina TaxID=274592 RepID=A0A317PT05_9HYPH|nr:sugar ABC transporter ATP-binding protein [Hoeflea marina]PWW01954.1 monosaccharide ABC transporter ATP-binding protein (CUT2 family) [Hoeflea marina]
MTAESADAAQQESAEPAAAQPFLRLKGVRKSYPGVQALAGLDLEVRPGEVIGLVGENGAGKSTLLKLLGGIAAPDGGTIEIDGVSHTRLSVSQSIAAGIAFVHQELNLFDNLDVAANVFIGREPRRFGCLNIVDTRRQRAAVAPLLDQLGAGFSPDTLVGRLSLAQQQLVEIAKALSQQARLVIFDEPTSSLPIAESEKLLAIMARLSRRGIAVIFVSHRLTEVQRAADRVVVLRDGRLAGRLTRAEISHDRLVKLMIGRDLKVDYAAPKTARGGVALALSGIRTAAYPRQAVDLDLHRGEILGLAGLVGSGRTELARAIFGIDPVHGGGLSLDGKEIAVRSASDAVGHGIFLVPEDRKATGILLDFTVAENISLPNLDAHASNWIVSAGSERRQAEASRGELGIKVPDVATLTATLSGGNQQKVVLAKWLAMQPRVIILDEPTRGIDVGSKSEIYLLMRALADAGVTILMISSDMEEVIGVSDRIAVMCEGRISGILTRAQFSEENVLLLAVGNRVVP